VAILARVRIVALAALLSGLPHALASGDTAPEYQVKAAFLYNFLKFVEWPEDKGSSAWVLGIVGRDPFGNQLEETVRGKQVNGRPIVVRHFARMAEVQACHIVFIPSAEFGRAGARSQPGVLLVGESPGFLDAGGAINFYLEDNRVRFGIQASNAVGVRISAQLLKLGSAH
jgi:hypothetical protein